ncbi:MAG TPA: substrate-binding domain-containing protein [Ohtaekwangia sp.]|nr:substrate-binding domain-containing protein [Ohtaekwangia sp.]
MSLGKNIRIKDIAKLAGVSAGTVDRVLHNRGRVSEEALKKITAVMEQIDYKPNLIARTLGSNKKYAISVIVPDPAADPYWAQAHEGIRIAQSEWNQYGVNVNVELFDLRDKESLQKTAAAAMRSQPDGIVIAPIFYHESLPLFEEFKQSSVPFVLFNTSIPGITPMSFIGQDLYESGRVGAELMVIGQPDAGKYAVLHIDEDIHDSVHLSQKEKGFRDYFLQKGRKNSEILDFNLDPEAGNFRQQLTDLFRDPELHGIFISTSKGTAVAAALLKEVGKRAIRVIGYDMLEDNLKYLREGYIDFLINQNPKRQVNLGISHLINHLMFKRTPPERELFPLEVITPENLNSYLGSGIH